MLTDHTIITRHGHFDVVAESHPVAWPDGSNVELHAVQVHGCTQPYLRALRHAGLHWAVIDLRKMCRTIEADLRILPPRDAPGAVLYNLRADYRNASTFVLATVPVAEALWSAYSVHQVATTPMVPA